MGKGSPFCSAWFVNRAADAMSSIEEMFLQHYVVTCCCQ